MSVQSANPITGNTNVTYVEVGSSHVAVDKDSGLIFGQVQLPSRTDPDKWFTQLTGHARPEGYKDELKRVVAAYDACDDIDTPDIIHQAAKDVLNGKTDTHVLVTTLNHIDVGRRIGLPSSLDVGRVRQNSKDISIGGLPVKNETDEETHDAMLTDDAMDTPNTIAARGGAGRRTANDTTKTKAVALPDADAEDKATETKPASATPALATGTETEEEREAGERESGS